MVVGEQRMKNGSDRIKLQEPVVRGVPLALENGEISIWGCCEDSIT